MGGGDVQKEDKMTKDSGLQAQIISFPKLIKSGDTPRKSGLNRNREGSVRKVNKKVYVDFIYLGERVREASGLPWSEQNAKSVRQQLDTISVAIKSGTFRFHKVFPNSKKRDYFREKENQLYGLNKDPDQVLFKDYTWKWYELLKGSGRISERTLWGYKGYINMYLVPFFGELSFVNLNKSTFDKFIVWAKNKKYRGKMVSNETINKIFVPLKMICKDAAIEYGWGGTYNPFFGFKRLPEGDPYEKISPFSLEEQDILVAQLSDHWKPFFLFAFSSGLRQGEQIALKPEDIDWYRNILHVRRAITLNEDGEIIEGLTKNKYSRRKIKLLPSMFMALKAQKKIYDQFGCKYFFCSAKGNLIHPSNLRRRIWIPALKKAGLEIREMKQTRHSFATVSLSSGKNPLWIAKVMGHRNTEMVIKVYTKYVEDTYGTADDTLYHDIYQGNKGSER